MKIDPSSIYRIAGTYKNEKTIEAKQKSRGVEPDKLQLSSNAQAFQVAYKAALESVDTRIGKVNSLKTAIDLGQYKVDSSNIADRILESVNLKK